jgi:hypothetical protein
VFDAHNTLNGMTRTCDSSMHREQLLASEMAACYYCLSKFSPKTVVEWCDGEEQDQTAICPHCGVDAVVGFNGPVDDAWMRMAHDRGFK